MLKFLKVIKRITWKHCFRAFGYRVLAHLFGGVPLITEKSRFHVVISFVQSRRIYTQVKNDLIEAISLLVISIL